MLRIHRADSPPVASFIEKMRSKYDQNVYFYNNILTAFVNARVLPIHIENLLKDMSKSNVAPDSYTKHTLLFHFCVNRNSGNAEAMAASITDLNTTGKRYLFIIHRRYVSGVYVWQAQGPQ